MSGRASFLAVSKDSLFCPKLSNLLRAQLLEETNLFLKPRATVLDVFSSLTGHSSTQRITDIADLSLHGLDCALVSIEDIILDTTEAYNAEFWRTYYHSVNDRALLSTAVFFL